MDRIRELRDALRMADYDVHLRAISIPPTPTTRSSDLYDFEEEGRAQAAKMAATEYQRLKRGIPPN